MMNVDLDSQTITKSTNRLNGIYQQFFILFRNEFFLSDYIYKIANFDSAMTESGFITEGYFDHYNMDAAVLKAESGGIKARREWGRHKEGSTIRYEFAFSPNTGFLTSPDLLLNDTELKISFDRTSPTTTLLETAGITNECTFLEIKDCYAVSEYVSSPDIREYFSQIDHTPFVYEFEEVDVLVKNLPLNETDIRFDNIRGGQLPSYLFIGLISQQAVNGDFQLSSSNFQANNVTDLNITLNGNSVHGYPMNIKNNSVIYPMQKFLDATGQLYNAQCGSCLRIPEFEHNYIHAHRFEAEPSETGWIGVNFKLSSIPTKPMSLVMWFVSPCAISVDKFHSVERINY